MPEAVCCKICNGTVSTDAARCPHCGGVDFLPDIKCNQCGGSGEESKSTLRLKPFDPVSKAASRCRWLCRKCNGTRWIRRDDMRSFRMPTNFNEFNLGFSELRNKRFSGYFRSCLSCEKCDKRFNPKDSVYKCPTHGFFHSDCTKGFFSAYCPKCNQKIERYKYTYQGD